MGKTADELRAIVEKGEKDPSSLKTDDLHHLGRISKYNGAGLKNRADVVLGKHKDKK